MKIILKDDLRDDIEESLFNVIYYDNAFSRQMTLNKSIAKMNLDDEFSEIGEEFKNEIESAGIDDDNVDSDRSDDATKIVSKYADRVETLIRSKAARYA